ncbi:MAG: hypothetical protein DRP58_11615 [Spirochaetes bacterium]|nr:MAG: hypothetical protein DRP58_11615 [Spirochaetota bacterium]
MKYPDFFDDVENIILKGNLSDFLGTFEDGIIEFKYTEIVKSAGHSCPTIAGAYIMTLKGLKALYGSEIPQRGNIKVEFSEDSSDGVAGVIANTISNITGATETSGFKGIGGNFVRHSLMKFQASINSSVRFIRIDTGAFVDVYYHPDFIPGDPLIQELMPKVLYNSASTAEKKQFGMLWQNRVKEIVTHIDDVITVSSN